MCQMCMSFFTLTSGTSVMQFELPPLGLLIPSSHDQPKHFYIDFFMYFIIYKRNTLLLKLYEAQSFQQLEKCFTDVFHAVYIFQTCQSNISHFVLVYRIEFLKCETFKHQGFSLTSKHPHPTKIHLLLKLNKNPPWFTLYIFSLHKQLASLSPHLYSSDLSLTVCLKSKNGMYIN